MIDCKYIVDLLPYYINKSLSREDNTIVIQHLAQCEKCRKEIALFILAKKESDILFREVPDDIIKSAFEKVKDNENNSVLSLSQALIMIRSAVSLTRKATKFAFQLI